MDRDSGGIERNRQIEIAEKIYRKIKKGRKKKKRRERKKKKGRNRMRKRKREEKRDKQRVEHAKSACNKMNKQISVLTGLMVGP